MFNMDLQYQTFVETVFPDQEIDKAMRSVSERTKLQDAWVKKYLSDYIGDVAERKSPAGASRPSHRRNLQCFIDELFPEDQRIKVYRAPELSQVMTLNVLHTVDINPSFLVLNKNKQLGAAVHAMIGRFETRLKLEAVRNKLWNLLDTDTLAEMRELLNEMCQKAYSECEKDPGCRGKMTIEIDAE